MDLTTLLAGPLGGIIGLGGSLIQKWLGMKEAREAHAMKLAEMEIVGKLDLQKADILFRSTVEEKSGEAFKAAIEAQASLRPAHAWAKTALAIFRPGLTLVMLISSVALAAYYHETKPELMEFVITSLFTMSNVAVGYLYGVRTESKFQVTKAFK